MISREDLIEWAQSLEPDSSVAIDDGGLTLVAFDPYVCVEAGTDPDAYLEVGGVPLEEED